MINSGWNKRRTTNDAYHGTALHSTAEFSSWTHLCSVQTLDHGIVLTLFNLETEEHRSKSLFSQIFAHNANDTKIIILDLYHDRELPSTFRSSHLIHTAEPKVVARVMNITVKNVPNLGWTVVCRVHQNEIISLGIKQRRKTSRWDILESRFCPYNIKYTNQAPRIELNCPSVWWIFWTNCGTCNEAWRMARFSGNRWIIDVTGKTKFRVYLLEKPSDTDAGERALRTRASDYLGAMALLAVYQRHAYIWSWCTLGDQELCSPPFMDTNFLKHFWWDCTQHISELYKVSVSSRREKPMCMFSGVILDARPWGTTASCILTVEHSFTDRFAGVKAIYCLSFFNVMITTMEYNLPKYVEEEHRHKGGG